MEKPTISVVIPVYNRERLIGRAIASALEQTYPPREVIVVDDGSNDQTGARCQAFGDKIHYLHQENAGPAVARNHGIEAAVSDWVAFLDSDDLWAPDHLERTAACIQATDGRAAIYFSNMALAAGSAAPNLWQFLGFAIAGPYEFRDDGADWILLRRQPTMLQASVMNRAAVRASGGFDPHFKRILEDTDLFCRMGLGGPLCAMGHIGCMQTADDDPGNRLTKLVPTDSPIFWNASLRLWSSLRRDPRLRQPRHRAAVGRKLANTHWRLSRITWKAGDKFGAVRHALQALAASPRLVALTIFTGDSRRLA
jgi:glycosyltransferase involved in cell wall biosynthesis